MAVPDITAGFNYEDEGENKVGLRAVNTHEVTAPDSRTRLYAWYGPNVCRCITPFAYAVNLNGELLRKVGAKKCPD